MIYELREYYIAPGKAPALHRRFQEVTDPLFRKHGIKVIGYWDVTIGDGPKLVYLCQYENMAQRDAVWHSFTSDPAWIEAKKESEQGGPLVTRVVNSVLKPTPYSELS